MLIFHRGTVFVLCGAESQHSIGLIMTHVQGTGYFQHANTITRKEYSTNVLWLRACVCVNKEQKELLAGKRQ